MRREADGKDDIGEMVLAGFNQKPAVMDLKASRRNLMFTTGHPVCRFHTDHRRSKTLKSSWRRMCWRSGPLHRPCKHYLLVSEGMLQYVGSHFEWKWKTGKLHEWDDFCNARFVFNHFLIDATHVPSVELISTVGIYGSVTHLKKLQFLLVQLYLERWTQHCWNWVCSLAWFQEGSETGRALWTGSSFWWLSNITYLVTKRYYLLCLQNTRERNWRRDITSRK